MFQSKKPNSSRGVRHARNSVCVQMSHAIHDVHARKNTQLPRVIAERAIHHVKVMDGGVLVRANETSCNKLNHAH